MSRGFDRRAGRGAPAAAVGRGRLSGDVGGAAGAGRRRAFLAGARLAAAVVMLCGASCAARPPRGGDPANVAPGDLTIDVSVLTGRHAEHLDLVQRRQSRYILFADGSLHADAGESLRPDVRPGLTRQLRRDQMADVWLLARQLGLADPEAGELPGNDSLIEPGEDEIVHIVNFGAEIDGKLRRWRFVRSAPADGELDPATTRFIRELAALAWIPDDPPSVRGHAVIRYDFGPDPYAMYRRGQDVEPSRPGPTEESLP